MTMKILAIIPAHNEENNIGAVIERLRRDAGGVDVLVVDDCSKDRTREVARHHGARVISLAVNLGIGGAVQTGFKYAVMKGYDVAVQVDADGQHDPTQIRELTRAIEGGSADVVIGSRYLQDRGYKTPVARRAGMLVFSWLTSVICRRKITDTTSGFRALNREVLSFFAEQYPVDFPDSEALIILHRKGFRIVEIPVTMCARSDGTSSIGLVKSFYYPYRSFLGILAALLRRER
ncbi:MAG: glycosyltransferase family 2 protein [Candidatus Eisenbacteria bacterium]